MFSIEKICSVCKAASEYKCPTCLIFYCSAKCCKIHRSTTTCDVLVKNVQETQAKESASYRFTTADTVSTENLGKLGNNEEIKNLLANPHLRNFLTSINNAKDAEKMMQLAMQEPLFVEFADACLKIVEPRQED